MPDIDIDFANRDQILAKIKHVPARLKNRKHNTGVYCHRVPVDPFKVLCTLDHKEADEAGFFKLDMLNVSIYKDIKSEAHLKELMELKDKLIEDEIVDGSWVYDLVHEKFCDENECIITF